jgi:hypothetical protein
MVMIMAEGRGKREGGKEGKREGPKREALNGLFLR